MARHRQQAQQCAEPVGAGQRKDRYDHLAGAGDPPVSGPDDTEAVLAAADDPDPDIKKNQVCEANFYSGEIALQLGKRDDAIRLFKLAAAECPKSYVEYEGARAELKALGAQL